MVASLDPLVVCSSLVSVQCSLSEVWSELKASKYLTGNFGEQSIVGN